VAPRLLPAAPGQSAAVPGHDHTALAASRAAVRSGTGDASCHLLLVMAEAVSAVAEAPASSTRHWLPTFRASGAKTASLIAVNGVACATPALVPPRLCRTGEVLWEAHQWGNWNVSDAEGALGQHEHK
jgi:hypothetical protein